MNINPLSAKSTIVSSQNARFFRAQHHVPHVNNISHKEMKIDEVIKLAEQVQKFVNIFNHELQFSVNQNTHQIIVKVIDSDTEKVIRVIPSEEMQRFHEKIKEAQGLLFDEKV